MYVFPYLYHDVPYILYNYLLYKHSYFIYTSVQVYKNTSSLGSQNVLDTVVYLRRSIQTRTLLTFPNGSCLVCHVDFPPL